MQCGPIRHRVNAKVQAIERPFEHTVIVRPTGFLSAGTEPDQRVAFQSLYRELIDDDRRNRRICDDVIEAVRDGRSPLVLTERNDHLDRLASQLSGSIRHLLVLRGGMGRKIADQLAAIPPAEDRVLLSTGKYMGEGFDDARLDTLMLTLPVSWRGTIAQYAGRLHRLYDSKREVRVYDYADLDVPMLARMFDRRCRGYEAVGYSITLPASAVPGWPAAVPLPADPGWKQDYAASVRRLIRDGVDAPLAKLFVHAAHRVSPEAEGVGRARSATEGQMEADLLCADSRFVIELDGAQHLSDAVAYRRDRRKDLLLQENGYRVLRFLAEDVGKELDAVLDTILRSLAHSQRRLS